MLDSDNKRVCIFSAQYLPHVGGVERYTYKLAVAMKKKNIDVTIVTSNLYGMANNEVTEDGIQIIRMPCYNFMDGRMPIAKFNKEFRTLYSVLKKAVYDLVIVNTRFYILSVVGAYYGYKYAKKNIIIEHGTTYLSFSNKIMDFFEHIYEHTITKIDKMFCKDYYAS